MIIPGEATLIDLPKVEVRYIIQVVKILLANDAIGFYDTDPLPDFSPGIHNLFKCPRHDYDIAVTFVIDEGADHGVYYIEERPK